MNKHLKLTVKKLAIDQLRPHPQNPRVHPPPGSPEWETLRASLEHDYFDPIVWNERNGCLVSGHLRTQVLEAEGVKFVDAVVVDYSEEEHLARMVAANTQIGRFDDSALIAILAECKQPALTGLTDAQVAELVRNGYTEPAPPESFPAVDENLPTQFQCPKCSYRWSGKPA
jgi:ParB-like chromosome segregation protein Spo0J